MSETLIVNARLVNEGREFDGDLRISRGRIAEIGSGLSARDGEYVIDATGRRLVQAAHAVEQRGLAGTVRPDEGADLALLDVEAEPIQSDHAAEPHLDVVDGQ